MPLGSSWEYTKHENAALNCSPQGPWAMPPRQGQSQFMTPVSSLKAPSWEASASRSEGLERSVVWGVDSRGGGGGIDGWSCCRREEARDSSVGRGVSSVGDWGGGTATRVSPLVVFCFCLAQDKNSQGGSSANRLLVL